MSGLGNVDTLYIENTAVKDLSALGKVYDLTFYGSGTFDVSALGKIHELRLNGFESLITLEGVEALSNVAY